MTGAREPKAAENRRHPASTAPAVGRRGLKSSETDAPGATPDVSDLYGHPLVRSGLASRIGWGVSDVWTIRKNEILDAADEIADRESDPVGHGAAAIIVASLYVGPDVMKVAAALSFDIKFVAECAGRLAEAAIWVGEVMVYPWLDDEAAAWVGCCLDSLVASGDVEKVAGGYRRLPERDVDQESANVGLSSQVPRFESGSHPSGAVAEARCVRRHGEARGGSQSEQGPGLDSRPSLSTGPVADGAA